MPICCVSLVLPRVKNGASCIAATSKYASGHSPTRRRGKKRSLLVATPLQDFACLREAASAKAGEPCIWAFLSSLIDGNIGMKNSSRGVGG